MAAVTDNTGTILISDGDSSTWIKKEKVQVSAAGNNVIIQWDRVHYMSYLYTNISAPSGASAIAVASAIKTFLNS